METLFPVAPVTPKGFSYWENFITEQEETQLIAEIGKLNLHPLIFQGFEAKRLVESYGLDYNFDKRQVSEGKPIPAFLSSVIERAGEKLNIMPALFKEVLVTEYPIGFVINWHRDAPPFDVVVGISLMSDCQFRFRPYVKPDRGRTKAISMTVRRRSVYVLSGEARTDWEHSIQPVKDRRYSITLRTIRKPA